MKLLITVREYAKLTTKPMVNDSYDAAQISPIMFDWLCRLSNRYRTINHPPLAEVQDTRTLQLDNYVGVLQSPCGTSLEILPKTVNVGEDIASARQLLKEMITTFINMPTRETETASLQRFSLPLNEWVTACFLDELTKLIRRGIRADYLRTDQQEPFMRGQLDMVRQMRQRPGKAHYFHQRYDIFSPDRAENRLIVRALEVIIRATQSPDHWRRAVEHHEMLHEIPASKDTDDDFIRWRNDRLMTYYRPIKPWCEMILSSLMPLAMRGEWQGISMLFPMERLFESYVVSCLRKQVLLDVKVKAQAGGKHLCTLGGKGMFELRPDILLMQDKRLWVMDVKWKRLDSNNREKKYGLSQADLYQLFAYGHKYMQGKGNMALIYPAHKHFTAPLAPFQLTDELTLWVLPIALEGDNKGRVVYHEMTTNPFPFQ